MTLILQKLHFGYHFCTDLCRIDQSSSIHDLPYHLNLSWALFIISHMEHFPTQSKLWKKDSAWAYARQNVLYWKKWLFALPTCLFNFASKVANINCQELQKHLTGKRLARRRRRELLCSSSLPEETPHRTEIGTRSGASCNWPAAAVEGSTSCFCPALPHCCSL